MEGDFVLDASTVLALYLPATQEQKDYAAKVVALLLNGAVAAAPGLFPAEVGSVLIRARRQRRISVERLELALDDLVNLT